MKTRLIDLTGNRIGRLVVLGRVANIGNAPRWMCRCDCGAEKVIRGAVLRRGDTVSCGCYRSDVLRKLKTTHGLYGSPTYLTFRSMLARCTDQDMRCWKDYGGRGITVCERWLVFENFLADMGQRPEGKTLDRIDVNGNYEPGNCRWATLKEQMANRRVK